MQDEKSPGPATASPALPLEEQSVVSRIIKQHASKDVPLYNASRHTLRHGGDDAPRVGTVIQGINAMGWAIPPYLIFASQYHYAAW